MVGRGSPAKAFDGNSVNIYENPPTTQSHSCSYISGTNHPWLAVRVDWSTIQSIVLVPGDSKSLSGASYEYEISLTRTLPNDADWPYEKKTICGYLKIGFQSCVTYEIDCLQKVHHNNYLIITNMNRESFVLCEVLIFGSNATVTNLTKDYYNNSYSLPAKKFRDSSNISKNTLNGCLQVIDTQLFIDITEDDLSFFSYGISMQFHGEFQIPFEINISNSSIGGNEAPCTNYDPNKVGPLRNGSLIEFPCKEFKLIKGFSIHFQSSPNINICFGFLGSKLPGFVAPRSGSFLFVLFLLDLYI
ncbi:DgyrCDS10750 [Dimorphilus gyrociliatus]|uniref:DgyrCDS10750 n=1 Tax=Dimorphilus gyrociliatus TaxID=2664684 RepID=A0A7I8W165_9ANNE|nr:DgyrCDS10750 [Dimorphilus gyrociliatus]